MWVYALKYKIWPQSITSNYTTVVSQLLGVQIQRSANKHVDNEVDRSYHICDKDIWYFTTTAKDAVISQPTDWRLFCDKSSYSKLHTSLTYISPPKRVKTPVLQMSQQIILSEGLNNMFLFTL